jgi:hypothetical protein
MCKHNISCDERHHGPSLLRQCSCGHHWVCGHEGSQVRLDTNGAHAWAAAAVWDAEGLVQVQVAHVSADVAGAGQTNLWRAQQ